MKDNVIRHEIKLQKSVIFILAVLAAGVILNAFRPMFSVKDAVAQLSSLHLSGALNVNHSTLLPLKVHTK